MAAVIGSDSAALGLGLGPASATTSASTGVDVLA